MNPKQKNEIVSERTEEDIEIVEGELLDFSDETRIEKRKSTDVKVQGAVGVVATIGTVAIGLFNLYKLFSGGRSERTPIKMRKRRRKR